MSKMLLIPTPDENRNVAVQIVNPQDFRDIQKLVGGTFQYLPALGANTHSLYANDEARLIGLPYNVIASKYWGDDIYGPALIIGHNDEEGDTLDVDINVVYAELSAL